MKGNHHMTTTTPIDDMTSDEILDAGLSAAKQALAQVEAIEKSRDEQPARLAEARAKADAARTEALGAEPWDDLWTALPGYTRDGELSGMLALPSITAKEMFGARLAFDALDCGDTDDGDALDEVFQRVFTMCNGDPGHLFLIFSAALRTIATVVMPMMLDDLEQHGSNYDARVLLAEARVKAWNGRVNALRGEIEDTDWE
jgi:hypothetical protein